MYSKREEQLKQGLCHIFVFTSDTTDTRLAVEGTIFRDLKPRKKISSCSMSAYVAKTR
jgi:hypothetical protein